MDDLISRREAIDLLWKALYEYEDKMERQFQESNELDVGDWILHREFVQNMSDIDRQTILAMPSAQPDRSLWFRIGEICVDESKGFISSGRAVEKIRELLREAERREK